MDEGKQEQKIEVEEVEKGKEGKGQEQPVRKVWWRITIQ